MHAWNQPVRLLHGDGGGRTCVTCTFFSVSVGLPLRYLHSDKVLSQLILVCSYFA